MNERDLPTAREREACIERPTPTTSARSTIPTEFDSAPPFRRNRSGGLERLIPWLALGAIAAGAGFFVHQMVAWQNSQMDTRAERERRLKERAKAVEVRHQAMNDQLGIIQDAADAAADSEAKADALRREMSATVDSKTESPPSKKAPSPRKRQSPVVPRERVVKPKKCLEGDPMCGSLERFGG